MNIYFKATDSKRYVPFNSEHPKPCLKNIPFCLAKRIYTIVENAKIRTAKLRKLETVFRNQKYPSRAIDAGIDVLETEKNVSKISLFPFVSTFSPDSNSIFPMMTNTIKNLQKFKPVKDFFKD